MLAMPVSARTTALRRLLDDGPTSDTTSKSARVMSLRITVRPVFLSYIGSFSTTDPGRPLLSTILARRFCSVAMSRIIDSHTWPARAVALAKLLM